MIANLVKSQGVSAFACLSSHPSVLWPCALVMLHDKPVARAEQFAVHLEVSVRLHGVEGTQPLVLCFDGDNIVPGQASLSSVNVDVSRSDICLDTIAREGYADAHMLSLTLQEPCSLRYPRALGSEVARLDTPCREIFALANATKVHILFDAHWLGRKFGTLQHAILTSSQLAGIPLRGVYAQTYTQVPSSILHLVDDADAALPSIEHAPDDPLPPYETVSAKRERQDTSSSPPAPDKHVSKRLIQTNPWASPFKVRGSPAPSTATDATVEVDTLQELVQIAVEKALPVALLADPTLPGLVSSAVAKALPALLPGILQGILPDMLPPPPAPAPPPAPVVVAVGPLHKHVVNHLNTIVDTAASKVLDDISNTADDAFHRIRTELSEDLADHKVDVQMVKDDHWRSFERECEEKAEALRQGISDVKEEVEEDIEGYKREKIDEIQEKIDEMGETAVGKVKRTLDVMANDVRFGDTHCRRCQCEADQDGQRGQRSMSMPLL